MVTALISLLVFTAKLALLIIVLLTSYAAALLFLGLCVLAFRAVTQAVRAFIGKALKTDRIRAYLARRKEVAKIYAAEKQAMKNASNNLININDLPAKA